MKRLILILAMFAVPVGAQQLIGGLCMNPSGNWIPFSTTGGGVTYATPQQYGILGQNNGVWQALQCDASGNPFTTFADIESGTNTTAAMVVGTGASLAASGSGSITATAVPASGVSGTTLASNVTASSLTSFGAAPALGTPASGVITNLSGNCASCTAGTATNAQTVNGNGYPSNGGMTAGQVCWGVATSTMACVANNQSTGLTLATSVAATPAAIIQNSNVTPTADLLDIKSTATIVAKFDKLGNLTVPTYNTATNCSSSASPAVCASAAAGSAALPTNAVSSSIVVNTTAVTANSQILVMTDDTLGTKLGVTCNSTVATLVGGLTVSARTAGTSFTVANNVAVVTNPLCISWMVVN